MTFWQSLKSFSWEEVSPSSVHRRTVRIATAMDEHIKGSSIGADRLAVLYITDGIVKTFFEASQSDKERAKKVQKPIWVELSKHLKNWSVSILESSQPSITVIFQSFNILYNVQEYSLSFGCFYELKNVEKIMGTDFDVEQQKGFFFQLVSTSRWSFPTKAFRSREIREEEDSWWRKSIYNVV